MSKRIAVIGAGYWGKNLVRNFSQLGRLDVICDTSKDVLNQYPDIETTNNIERAMRIVDSVVIATPAVSHYQLVKKALILNKDVFVEKPLALTFNEGRELLKLAESKMKILMVGHLLEYHPAIKKLKRMIDGGELGQIYYIYSNRLNLGKIRQEENILWSFAPHDISVILRLLDGKTLKNVHCSGGSYINDGIPDVTVSSLSFSDNVQAHIFVSWLNPFKEQKLVVMGSKKMAVFDDTLPEKLIVYPHRINCNPLTADKKQGCVIEIDKTEPLKLECLHYIDCIDGYQRPLTDGQSALKVLRVLEACQMSLEQEKKTIFL